MSAILDQRCLNHASREAVVRCPECRRFFCRECVVEHRGRMICTSCMAAADGATDTGKLRAALWPGLGAAGFFLAWLIFYYAGVMLARVPSDFFEGTR